MIETTSGWLRRCVPTRDQLERNRFVRPFAGRVLRSDLWRFSRRSVPRGVALGLFVGVLIPFAHSIVAAFCAVFVRANVPVAIATTFASNPATWMLLYPAAYEIGKTLFHLERASGLTPISATMEHTQTDHLLQNLTGAGLDTAVGLLVLSIVLSSAGYAVSALVWRGIVARRRCARLAQARIAEPAG
ncbi:hypothetical protein B0I00_0110 [Novosphingobium kunmingense]|uniref:DUF2062 domain-containing protein n=1 Tax=Novosphingobium kunmingense TaxID=1211806 RepID=A0A2N0I1B3_9SPHN|nr:DUF2062 domain-containing protein [Novosphingobium kunmingense]PKB24931.1 hypothetical protein B0I00_0110 [Novosphingobium kunmingense]